MSPLIKHPKKRGEWVELQFMARAAEHGLTVSKPWGESSRYDFVVERAGVFRRVQVKSTTQRVGNSYVCGFRTTNRKTRYTKQEIDFVAAYVVPADAWYILPIGLIARLAGNIWLSPHKAEHRHKRYLEAWRLLQP